MQQSVEMWLWLLLVMQPHSTGTYKILNACGFDIRDACVRVRDGGFSFLKDKERELAKSVRMKEIRDLQRLCAENDINIIPFDSPDYPENLRIIENPPIVLFAQGDIGCLKNRLVVSAVGTRTPSEYSVDVASRLSGELAAKGAAVVSGLAVGLDTAAHRGAIEAGGVTVGVLACGSLYNYPADSRELKKEIVGSGGAIISELLPQDGSAKWYFPMRNRIIAGLADSVVVLEAAAESGALLTARHAFEMRRRVFVIPPHDIFDERYDGLTGLYKDGASPVFCAEDILGAFTPTRDAAGGDIRSSKEDEPSRSSAQKSAKYDYTKPNAAQAAQNPQKENPKEDSKENSPKPKTARARGKKAFLPYPDDTSELEKAILDGLAQKDMTTDEIAMRCPDASLSDILQALMELELEGFVKKDSSGVFSRL